MTAHKLISEIISSTTVVVITRPTLPLAREISEQLSQHKNISVSKTEVSKFDVLIHFAGFEKSSFSETLNHTTVLHELMGRALSNKAKFYLVMPEPLNNIKQTSIDMLIQFGKIFNLDYRIIVIDQNTDLKISAEETIKTFINNHKYEQLLTQFTTYSKQVVHKKDKNSVIWPVLLLVFASLYFINLLAVGVLLKCTSSGISESNWNKVTLCATPLKTMVLFSGLSQQWDTLSAIGQYGNVSSGLSAWASEGFEISKSMWGGQPLSMSQVAVWTEKGNSLADQLAYLEPQIQTIPGKLIDLKQVGRVKQLITKINLIFPSVQRLLARDSAQILLLLQDNTELRPTGGYLSDVAIISLENGKIKGVDFYSTQSLDELLRGQVDPPQDFAEITGQNLWYLRDSNWDPSFPESAQRTAWFVEKELGIKPVWVIAGNFSLLKAILEVGGDIKVDGTQITSQDLVDKHLVLSQPDSSVSIVGRIAEELFRNWPSYSEPKQQKIIMRLIDLLESRQLLLYEVEAPDKSLELVGWDGGLKKENLFYAVDSNIGANRTNYYIKTRQYITFDLSEEDIVTNWNLKYENFSPAAIWPAGDYKNYLRLYYPGRNDIERIEIDGQVLTHKNFSVTRDGQVNILGILVNVKASSVMDISIQFKQPLLESSKVKFQVQLLNQPGRESLPTEIKINLPAMWAVDYRSPGLVASGAQFSYNTNLLVPESVDLELITNYGQ